MRLTRRSALRALGGGSLAAIAGGAVWTATRTPAGALEPWRQASLDDPDPRLAALSFAVLSANPHNRQSWLVSLDADGGATLYVDADRLLPVTDPFGRQIAIGLGCFLETFRIAASALGFAADIAPFPEGERADALDDRPVARISLRGGAQTDPLFRHVLDRRTVKEPYEAEPPAAAERTAVADAPELGPVSTLVAADPARVDAVRDLMWRGHVREMTTPAALQESIDLMRIGRAEIEASPDGIDLGGPFLEGLSLVGAMTRERLADPESQAFAQGMAIYREVIGATPAVIWMTTPSNTRSEQLAAGRAWTRAHLTATGLGYSLHPISQTLQEYPEMADLYAVAHATLAPDGGVVQMLGRFGRPSAVGAPSPRWPAASRVLDRRA